MITHRQDTKPTFRVNFSMLKSKDILIYAAVFIILYAYHLKFSLIDGDDIYFSTINIPYLEWIKMRYETWSGRLIPDTMLFALLGKHVELWRMLNPLFIMLTAFSIVRLFKKEVTYTFFIISILLLGYFSKNVMSSAFFWTTGSICYLWPIALGLYAMIPYADKFFRNDLNLSKMKIIIYSIVAFLATISNEQLALCMAAFSIIFHIGLFIQRKHQKRELLLLTPIILLGVCILFLAPGQKVRFDAEVKHWFPGFDQLSLRDHVYIGVIWLFKKLFSEMKNIMLLLSLIAFISYFKEGMDKWYFKVFGVLLGIVVSNLVLMHNTDLFYNFDLIGKYKITQNILHFHDRTFFNALFPYVFWSIYSVMLSFLIIKKSKHKIFMFLCLSASIASLVLMFFSPTIYASANRVLAVSSILFVMVIMKLILENNLFKTKLGIALLSCLPILNLLQLLFLWFKDGYLIYY